MKPIQEMAVDRGMYKISSEEQTFHDMITYKIIYTKC